MSRSTELLRIAHAHPGITRAAAAQQLRVSTGAATEMVARLSRSRLLAEIPAPPSGVRGRPTTSWPRTRRGRSSSPQRSPTRRGDST